MFGTSNVLGMSESTNTIIQSWILNRGRHMALGNANASISAKLFIPSLTFHLVRYCGPIPTNRVY